MISSRLVFSTPGTFHFQIRVAKGLVYEQVIDETTLQQFPTYMMSIRQHKDEFLRDFEKRFIGYDHDHQRRTSGLHHSSLLCQVLAIIIWSIIWLVNHLHICPLCMKWHIDSLRVMKCRE